MVERRRADRNHGCGVRLSNSELEELMGKKQFAALPFRLDNRAARDADYDEAQAPMECPEGVPDAQQEAASHGGARGLRGGGPRRRHRDTRDGQIQAPQAEGRPQADHRRCRLPDEGARPGALVAREGRARAAIWVTAEPAARLVHKGELRRLIARFAAQPTKVRPRR